MNEKYFKDGRNSLSWLRSIALNLIGRSKLGYIDREIEKLNVNDAKISGS